MMTLGNAVRSFCGPSQNTVTHISILKVFFFRSIARILMNPPPGKCDDSPLYTINATWRTSAWKLLFLSGTVFEVPCVHLPRQLSSLLLLVDLQGTPLEIGGGVGVAQEEGRVGQSMSLAHPGHKQPDAHHWPRTGNNGGLFIICIFIVSDLSLESLYFFFACYCHLRNNKQLQSE